MTLLCIKWLPSSALWITEWQRFSLRLPFRELVNSPRKLQRHPYGISRFPSSATTGKLQYGTLPFLQTSYPYRCRSRKQRSRIGMRFPSSASPYLAPPREDISHFPSSRPPTLIAVARGNNGHALACASRHPLTCSERRAC